MSVPPVLYVASFGYNHRTPPVANAVIDVRWMPNPFKTAELHDLSGLDAIVQEWLFSNPRTEEWFAALMDTLDPQLTAAEGKDSRAVSWAFGCAGGHDRAVAVAEHVAASVRRTDMAVLVDHLDIHRRGGR